jgi:large subunit ribosomal protein L3
MPFILGRKLKMTQVWDNDRVLPVTLVQAGPTTIIQIKNKEKDGYNAVQIGFDATKKKITKAMKGHLKNLGNFRYLKEFKLDDSVKTDIKVGDLLEVDLFQKGDKVKISGLSKGKGFQGVVKRHGFGGGPTTHGQKNRLRAPGSIGSTAPQRVLKGRKMAGRMGGEKVTIKNLEVVSVDKDKNILAIKGAVPGLKGMILKIFK